MGNNDTKKLKKQIVELEHQLENFRRAAIPAIKKYPEKEAEKYKAIFDAFECPIFITTQHANIQELNKSAKDFINKNETIKKNTTIFQIVPAEMRSQLVFFFSALMIDEKKHTSTEIEFSRNENHYHYELIAHPINFAEKKSYMFSFYDVKEKKIFEKKIFEAIIDTEERERKQFALNLHDEIGPFLSGIKLYLHELGFNDISPEKRKEMTSYLSTMVDEAVATTKSISNKLMPNVLQDYGIVKAVETFTKKINTLGKINIVINSSKSNKRYEEKIELIVYRILIELINNTIKHAKAENIIITIEESKKRTLKISYKDNGIGFDFDKELTSSKGIGLMSLLSRLKIINGKFSFDSSPGNGINMKMNILLI